MRVMNFKVKAPWRKAEYLWATLEGASAFANEIFNKYGIVVAVERVS